MSLVFTANHDADVVQGAVLESLSLVTRPASSWALLGPGEFGDAHRDLGMTRKTFDIGPLLGMAQSLPTAPSASLLAISIVELPGLDGEGLTSRANRAASGPHWDAAGWAISIQPYAPG